MNKNIYLSKQEQMIFNIVSYADIAYIDEIRDFCPDLKPHQINKICHSLSSKGYLYRLKRGVYLIQKKPSDLPLINMDVYRGKSLTTSLFKCNKQY